jgi:opacity protein-like surface antigen
VGAATILSSNGADLEQSVTMLGANLGAGVLYGLTPNWAVRGDVRGLAMLPWGEELRLTPAREVDAMWMERATIGLAYRF